MSKSKESVGRMFKYRKRFILNCYRLVLLLTLQSFNIVSLSKMLSLNGVNGAFEIHSHNEKTVPTDRQGTQTYCAEMQKKEIPSCTLAGHSVKYIYYIKTISEPCKTGSFSNIS